VRTDAGLSDCADVTVIGAAAPTENGELWKVVSKLGVTRRELEGIAGIKLRARIQFRMTLHRCVGAQPANALYP
jgi:hypothetical protein